MQDKFTASLLTLAALLLVAPGARAALEIEVASGVRDPVPVAIVPFTAAAQGDGGLDVAGVIQNDLEGCGRFRALAREHMPATPARAEDVAAPAWKNAGTDYVVVGRITGLDGGKLQVDFDLVNTLT